MTAWDIAVIGAGVAGSTAAALLARQGLRVILLEKGTFPRQKVCGEFLSPEGVGVLSRLGVWPQLEASQVRCIDAFTLTTRRRQTRHRLPAPGWGVSRWVLDHVLWEHAERTGVATREHCTVRQVTGNFQRGFTVSTLQGGQASTVVRARAVLCAAGRLWPPRVQQRRAIGRGKGRFVGLKAHIGAVPLPRHVELHTIRHGYCGMVEVADGVTNLCCWVTAADLRGAGGTPQRFLAAALRDNPHLCSRLQGLDLTDVSWTTTSFTCQQGVAPVVSEIWNIGDCAGMVAPLTGDGMGMGLRAAELAATMLRQGLSQASFWPAATAEYSRCWYEEFRPRLQWGRRLEALLLRPRLAELACGVLYWVPQLMPQLYRRTRQLVPATALTVGTFS